ncbi:hypothetical protein EB796_004801 [Bugula neritina]|uniref:EF-hand domain-containing protein n=1 Tax=Bugula neritina TaxID=10212 RepID=A0A7J7KG75_BUGNE|nr:hypothetical protein EB796_004801 [Bugula neritina]
MAQHFKEDDIQEFKECFEMNNVSHYIVNEKSLRFTMRSLGFSPTIEESVKYWNKYKSTNGIPFDQFLNILYDHSRAEDCENEIMAAFAAQDRKKNGLISAADFKAIMCNSGEKVNARMVEAVLRESGQTGSQIRYAEVVRTLLSPPTDY